MTKSKGTASHYRRRIERLKRRSSHLAVRIAEPGRSEAAVSHDVAEKSALDWAVSILEPWFAKDDVDEPTLFAEGA